MRAATPIARSWGAPLAVMHVVMVRYGAAQVTATELLQSEGDMHGAVELESFWDIRIPPHLEGIVQLQTSAKVNGQGTVPVLFFWCLPFT